MSFKITPISNDDKKTITAWADMLIEQTKQKMYKGENYLIWNKIYYCKAGDTWIDERWWIETAKTLLKKYNQEYLNWNIIIPLEILNFYFPDKYRDLARQKIDEWYCKSGYDPEYWWNLIELVYPEHQAFQEFIDPPETTEEWSILARAGYEKAKNSICEVILEEVEQKDMFRLNERLIHSGKYLIEEILSNHEIQQIKELLINWSAQKISFYEDDSLYQSSLIQSGIIMQWQEVVNNLSNNNVYLNNLIIYIKECLPAKDILWWSLTDKKELVENLVLQLKPVIIEDKRIHITLFPSDLFALAIAWKRSQSKQWKYIYNF